MTNTNCTVSCCTQGSSDQPAFTRRKPLTYIASILGLCAICCAVPAALTAAGLVGLTTAAYIGAGLKGAVGVIVLLGLGYLIRQIARTRR